jgi:PEGA domain
MDTSIAATSDPCAQIVDSDLPTIVPLDPSDDDITRWFLAPSATANTAELSRTSSATSDPAPAKSAPAPAKSAAAPAAVDAARAVDAPAPVTRDRTRLRRFGLIVLVALVVSEGAYIAFRELRGRAQPSLVFFDTATVTPLVEERPAAPTTSQLPAATPPAPIQGARQDPPVRVLRSDGRLTINSVPTGASVTVDGRERGTTPLTVTGLAPGTHRVVLDGDGSSITEIVKIAEGASVSLIVPFAQPAVSSGWIAVSAPIDIQVFEGGRLLGVSQSDRIMVPSGAHRLDLVNTALGYRTSQQVQVMPGRVAAINVVVPTVGVNINALPWAEVFIDGERVGETPIANVPVRLGPHRIVLRHPELGSQTRDVVATAASPTRLSVDLRP